MTKDISNCYVYSFVIPSEAQHIFCVPKNLNIFIILYPTRKCSPRLIIAIVFYNFLSYRRIPILFREREFFSVATKRNGIIFYILYLIYTILG